MKYRIEKTLSAVVAFVICFTVMCGLSEQFIMDINAETTTDATKPFGYDSADKFVSECMLGRATDVDGSRLQFEQIAYKPVLWDYTYQNIAEAIIDDESLVINSVFWKNMGYCLNGEFVDLVTWKKIMYETLIMDWLTYQFESDTFESEFEQASYKYAWKITKYLMKDGNIYNELGDMSVEDAMRILDDDFYAANETLGKASEFNSIVSDIQTVASTGIDFYKQLTKVFAAKEACNSRIKFLEEVKTVTDDNDLIAAIDEVTANMKRSFAETAFREGSFTMLKTVCNQAWGVLTDKLQIPCLKEIQLGKAGLDWIFNSSDTSTKRLEVVILYIINADFTKAYQNIRDNNYLSNPTELNALNFNNAYLSFVNYQAYASYITELYIAEALLEGAGNALYNLISSNNITTYNDLKQMLDGNISTSKSWYNMVGKYYNLYNSITAQNESMGWADLTNPNQPQKKPAKGDRFTIGNLTYYVTDDNEVEVYDCDEEATGTISIPKYVSYSGFIFKVTSIGFQAFSYNCDNIKNIIIPNTVSIINDFAFEDCDGLESVIIGENVTSIGYNAFCSCDKLRNINIPDKVDKIQLYAFSSCYSLENIDVSGNNSCFTSENGVLFNKNKTILMQYPNGKANTEYYIPENTLEIQNGAFEHSRLKTINIPDSVILIKSYAFGSCSNIENIVIPDSVQNIEVDAFANCTNLQNINVSNDNNIYCDVDGVLLSKDKRKICDYPDGRKDTEFIALNSVNTIEKRAFYWLSNSCKCIIIENSDCDIYDDEYTISESTTIYGYENSTAQEYAEKYDRKFSVIGSGDVNCDSVTTIADIVLIQKSLVNSNIDTKLAMAVVDMNQDGKFNVFDLIIVRRMVLNT